MQVILENKIVKKISNIPFVWNVAQNVIGARSWKDDMYPSVFERKGGSLLDFGCSSGNETKMFLDFDYYGVDIDAVAIAAAKEKFKQQTNVQFFNVDIIKDGFKRDFFDHLLFAGTAHHLVDADFEKIITILMQNLKKGGQLHFFDPIRQTEKDNWMTKLIIRSDQGKFARTEETYKTIFDPHVYNIAEWKIFPSPDRFIKFPDFLYIRIIK